MQDHETEQEAFDRFADALPDQVTPLVDTYDTLRSGGAACDPYGEASGAARQADAGDPAGQRRLGVSINSSTPDARRSGPPLCENRRIERFG
ncbi:hypothetical protein LJK88_22780 [Paenibacillus sp. P26]|nr:hypothetical protein LJK88_22780 [Paenibacillus sp. P26]